jgi:hypothetical protein
VLTIGSTGALTTVAALWMMFQHIPAWYRPAELDEATRQRARHEATALTDYVGDQLVRAATFDVVVRDTSVNEWLGTLVELWPDAGRLLPPEAREPAIAFETDRVRIGVLLAGSGWQAIVSATIMLGLSPDGRSVEIALRGVQGGSLPVPRRILVPLIDRVLREAKGGLRGGTDEVSPTVSILRDIESADSLFAGLRIRNRFVWQNGNRPFRIEAVSIDRGVLRIVIEPL